MLYPLMKSLLMALPAETAHNLVMGSLKMGFVPFVGKPFEHDGLKQTICSLDFDNPVGLAAGFDKNAEALSPMSRLGFGFLEVGTVTPKPQPGNPKPRVFRDAKSESVVNRMGFPGKGLAFFKDNLTAYLNKADHHGRPVVGVNIGKNKTTTDAFQDYVACTQELSLLADYLVVNVSSPNTPGLRDLQKGEFLLDLLNKVLKARQVAVEKTPGHHQPPLFVKIAPDMNSLALAETVGAIIESSADGIIVSNTTVERPDGLSLSLTGQQGGLSGKLLKPLSTQVIRDVYALTKGKIPIIGVGGISRSRDAYEKIKAGANLLQLYTALIYQGPGLVKRINRGLALLLQADGYDNIGEAVGSEHKTKTIKEENRENEKEE